MKKAKRSFLLTVVVSAMALPIFASSHDPNGERAAIQIRALLQPAQSNSSPDSVTSTTSTSQTTSTTPPATTTTTSSTSTTSTSGPSAPPSQVTSSTNSHSSESSSTQPPGSVVIPTTTTDAGGQVITTFVTTTPTSSNTPPSPTNTPSNSGGGGGLSTGSIVGLSVSGGIAVLGIILFFVWKFTRKRFSDFDDNEAIKWPELNTHSNEVHALPTNSTGRAGFGPENDSDLALARAPSPAGAYANSIAASSVPEMYGGGDPYAVPPLPHLNPSQPYRDEPGAYGQPAGYYDPYRGPVPNTFTDTVSDAHGAESIPMTQMARGRSPGPQVAYDMQGRGSPAPQAPYDMQGRGSPAPQAAMGYPGMMEDRTRTPNPAAALAQGRASPSPQAGYGYGPR